MRTRHPFKRSPQEPTRAARWVEDGPAACEREGSEARRTKEGVAPLRRRQATQPQTFAAERCDRTKPSGRNHHTYDIKGRITRTENYNGQSTLFTYDALNRPKTVQHPDGSEERMGYQDKQQNGWIIDTLTDRQGLRTLAKFDGLGRLNEVEVRGLDGSSSRKAEYNLGVFGTVRWHRSFEGVETYQDFDKLGRLRAVRTPWPEGQGYYTTHYTYNDLYRQIEIRDPRGARTTLRHNPLGHLVEKWALLENGDTVKTSYSVDNLGNLVRKTDPNGLQETYTYDWQNLPTHARLSDSLEIRTLNSLQGLPLKKYLGKMGTPEIDTATYTYDGLLRPLTLAYGDTTASQTWTWDTRNGYTHRGSLVQHQRGDGLSATYTYNTVGDRTSRTLRLPLSATDTLTQNFSYHYLPGSLLDSTHIAGKGQKWTFDTYRRPLALHLDGQPIYTAASYHGLTRLAAYNLGNGNTMAYTYAPTRDLLTQIRGTTPNGSSNYLQTFDHDPAGLITTIQHHNGERANYTYDALQRLTHVDYPTGNVRGTREANYVYRHDLGGRRTSWEHDFGTQQLRYKEQSNQLQTQIRHDSSTVNYSWDHRGNRIAEQEKGTSRHLGYNARNELRTLSYTDSASQKNIQMRYFYDETGRRIAAQLWQDNAWHTQKEWAWDGVNVSWERDHSSGEQSWYAFMGWQRLGELRQYGDGTQVRYWFLNDHLGSVQQIQGQNGQSAGRYRQDPYGNLESYQGTVQTNYTYTGKGRDALLQTVDFGARQYDAETGTWTSPDPVRQFDSPYLYGNPLHGVDLDGMDSYVLYDPTQFENQAYAQYTALSEEFGTETHLIPISSQAQFDQAWIYLASQENNDAVSLLFHGRSDAIWTVNGDMVLTSNLDGFTNKGTPGRSIMTLDRIGAKRIDLLTCNNAREGFAEFSVFKMFYYSQGRNTMVTGWDGGVSYNWPSYLPRLSNEQHGYDSPKGKQILHPVRK